MNCERGRPFWTAGNRASINPALLRPPCRGRGAQVAQLVEHCTENAGVGGSIPPLGTISIFISFMFNHLGFDFVPLFRMSTSSGTLLFSISTLDSRAIALSASTA